MSQRKVNKDIAGIPVCINCKCNKNMWYMAFCCCLVCRILSVPKEVTRHIRIWYPSLQYVTVNMLINMSFCCCLVCSILRFPRKKQAFTVTVLWQTGDSVVAYSIHVQYIEFPKGSIIWNNETLKARQRKCQRKCPRSQEACKWLSMLALVWSSSKHS